MRFEGDGGLLVLAGERVYSEVTGTAIGNLTVFPMIYRINAEESAAHVGTLVLFPGLSPKEFLKAVGHGEDV